MKRLVIIVEGETEESFVNNVLKPYFYSRGINNTVQCFKTKHSNGGLSKYSYIKKDILNVLYEHDVVVSTMMDFYRLPSDFPGFKEAAGLSSSQEQTALLEQRLKEDIERSQGTKFEHLIPYIQLHEFEALIFSSINGIDKLFERSEVNYRGFLDVIKEFPNPEDINNGPNTAPSMRLKNLIQGYNKVVYGINIIQEIGMRKLLEKCPRFSEWIKKLEEALA